MSDVVAIENLKDHVGETVTLQGWLYNKTGKGKLQFLQVRDGTGICQAVVFRPNVGDEAFAEVKELTQESSLRLTGLVKAEPRAPGVPGGYEIDAQSVETVQVADAYPITPKEHGIEFLMQNRHLWLRSSRQWAVMRVRGRGHPRHPRLAGRTRLSQRGHAHPHACGGGGHDHAF